MKKLLLLLLCVPLIGINTCEAQEENKRDYTVRCTGITKKGNLCKLRTTCNNSRCYHHGGNCYNKNNSSKSSLNANLIRLPIKTVNGMKFISITINGRIYDFLIDTGASDMMINEEVERYLLNNRKINKLDYRQKDYVIADGSIIKLNTSRISSIIIGGKLFNNINVAIGDENASLLLGNSFLNKYNWRFNGNYLELMQK